MTKIREDGLIETENNGFCKISQYAGRQDGMVKRKEYACGLLRVYYEGRRDGLTKILEDEQAETRVKFFEGRKDGKYAEEYYYDYENDKFILRNASYANREDGMTLEEYSSNGNLHRFYWDNREEVLTPEQQMLEKQQKIEQNKNKYQTAKNTQKILRAKNSQELS